MLFDITLMRKYLTLVMALIVLALPLASCEEGNADDVGVVTGLVINEQEYPTVKIGEQTWSAVNYNGPGGMNYNNAANNANYGKLYTYTEARSILLPAGWRIPTKQDYEKLLLAAGGKTIIADGETFVDIDLTTCKNFRSVSDWKDSPGTNSTGFAIYPTGVYQNASFSSKGELAAFWSSTTVSSNVNYSCALDYHVSFNGVSHTNGLALRFVKDN